MENQRERVPSEVLRRGYSDDELSHVYELGRFFLENGDLWRGEIIMRGICEIAPDFAPGWLGMCYVHFCGKSLDNAVNAARKALLADPGFSEASLALAAALMSSGDYNTAGTLLGEIGEKIDEGLVDDPKVIRFFKGQLARYQNR